MPDVIAFPTPASKAATPTMGAVDASSMPQPAFEPAAPPEQATFGTSPGADQSYPAAKPPIHVSRRRFVGVAAAAAACNSPEWAKAGDANLIALCEQAIALESADAAATSADPSFPMAADWHRVVNRLSALPARTWPGLRAKARLLQLLSPSLACGPADDDTSSPEENLIASLVRDVLRAR